MDEVDTVLARLAAVSSPRSLGADPDFVARLDRSAVRGDLLGMARSIAFGIAVAGLMVALHPPRIDSPGGFLLATADGVL